MISSLTFRVEASRIYSKAAKRQSPFLACSSLFVTGGIDLLPGHVCFLKIPISGLARLLATDFAKLLKSFTLF